uniref:Reverse transcriptase Ty1/copia-type domain-containing protein n=1 Tax=Nicotiana tabacum TaxID=4097 RepID=A0A1S3YUL0_TOBAC|nr:PREDICTED: uncharacterized protein LOC107779728 [Nicotiana tabacum]
MSVAANVYSNSEVKANNPTKNPTSSTITTDQYKQLMSILLHVQVTDEGQNQFSTASVNFADSGATDHMTSNKNLLTNITDLPIPILVTLPNGYKVKVTFIGTVHINSIITLSKVLYLPTFKYNLISVYKLILDTSLLLTFSSTACLLHGPSLKKPLGLGKMAERLYLLNSTSTKPYAASSAVPIPFSVHVNTVTVNKDKFSPRSTPCIFLGYPPGKKAYKLLQLSNKKILISRDVVFHENIFPYSESTSPKTLFLGLSNSSYFDYPTTYPPYHTPSSHHPIPSPQQNIPAAFPHHNTSSSSVYSPLQVVSTPSFVQSSFAPPSPSVSPVHTPKNAPRYPSRPHHLSSYLSDYVCGFVSSSSPFTLTSIACFPKLVCFSSLSFTNQDLLKALDNVHEPTTYQQAGQHPAWQEAMLKEFETLEANATWVIVPLPGKKPIENKWVYKIKHKADVSIERFKAMLVVRGDTQQEWVDYTETFSHVVKMTNIRSIIDVADKKGWNMFQLDVNNAFLHRNLDEEVYMRIPQWMVVSGTNMICKLKKSLYGLKQASRQCGNDDKEMSSLKQFLDSQFKIKDLGHLHYFLGLEILSEPEGAIVCQRKFSLDLLSEFNCLDCTPVASPLDVAVKFKNISGEPFQFMHAPSSVHLTAAYHVLRYVKGTFGQGLLMSNASNFSLEAYYASDWATCSTSRRSVSGYLVLLGGSLLTWKSKKHHTVSLSSAEAEYRSMRRVVAELAWLTKMLSELFVTFIILVPLNCDSQSAIYIARNPVFHERTKHIELDCHLVHEKLHEGLISLSFVPSSLQFADMLIKPLSGVHHRSILSKMGMANHPPT